MSKKISITPNLFNISKNKSLKNKRKQAKKSENTNMNNIRKRILEKLNKSTSSNTNKQNKQNNKTINYTDNSSNDSFSDSLNFLENKVKTMKKETTNNNSNMKPAMKPALKPAMKPAMKPVINNNVIHPTIQDVHLELPESLQETSVININSTGAITTNKFNSTQKNREPNYGCLKKGTKPTYSMQNKTTKNRISFSPDVKDNMIKIVSNDNVAEEEILSELPFQEVNENSEIVNNKPENLIVTESKKEPEIDTTPLTKSLNEMKEEIKINKHKRINKHSNKGRKTRKEFFGKNARKKGKVSIEINSGNTKKTLKKEKHILDITPLKQIKNYLKEKNFLEVDSTAPEDVLRSIYTNTKLSGDVENKNPDVLYNNYMNDNNLEI